MNLTDPEVPELDRTDSQSALDFMYWLIQYVDISYSKSSIIPLHKGDREDGETMMQAIMYCSSQIELPLVTSNYELFRKHCEPFIIDQEMAFRKRGAVLFFDESVAVSMGDGKRIIEYYDGEYACRYLSAAERTSGYWVGALIPEMIYL